jgi:DNA-binding HxlR family transcriptional regulator
MAGPATTNSPQVVAGPSAGALCPHYHQAIELIGKRWTGAIVHSLMAGPLRFSQISAAIPQISDRLLSERLKELESYGIVSRQVLGGSPVRVEYELTAKGHALEPTLCSLRQWARQWMQ